MNQKSEIINFLKKDQINNINILNFIENYPIHNIEKVGDSVLVKGTSDKDWIYISSKSVEELKILKNRLRQGDKNFAAIEDWMIPILDVTNKIKWKLSTIKLILPYDADLENIQYKVNELTHKDAEFIYNNSDYKDIISIDYISERITNGLNSCIRDKETPIAWAITQDDGAIGFLNVLSKYRRKGYARDVMIDLIKKVRSKNKNPFVHIEEENENSMRLATSIGFKKDKRVSWFEIE